MFSEKTLEMLRKAGWSEDYHKDPSPYEQYLKSLGHPVHSVQLEFLSRFGGLSFHSPTYGRSEYFHFDVLRTTYSADDLAGYSDGLGASLSPIGEVFNGNMELVMTPDGTVYAIVDDTIILYGNSGEEAIENLCTNGPVRSIE